jgi:hypothetical protein
MYTNCKEMATAINTVQEFKATTYFGRWLTKTKMFWKNLLPPYTSSEMLVFSHKIIVHEYSFDTDIRTSLTLMTSIS